MRSFVPAVLVAALAAFTSAAPVDLLNGPPNSSQVTSPNEIGFVVGLGIVNPPVVPNIEVNLPRGLLTSSPVKEAEDIASDLEAALALVGARAAASSIAGIFQDLLGQITPNTDRMAFLSPSDASVTEITNTAESIKNPMMAAISALQALTGAEQSALVAPADGAAQSGELSVSQVALVVARPLARILTAMQNAARIAQSSGHFDPVRGPLVDLGKQATALTAVSIDLVDGLDAALGVMLKPIQPIIVQLHVGLGLVF